MASGAGGPGTAVNPQAHTGSNIGDLLREAAAALAAEPGLYDGSPRLEAELLLMQATGWSRSTLAAWPERPLDRESQGRFQALLKRRLSGEPMAYIRGRQAFWTLDLRVSPATLIPRPETELLVEIALELGPPGTALRVADLGTGSGAVAAALASQRPAWEILAIERSAAALAVARGNFRELDLGLCRPLRAHWLAPVGDHRLDLILANPPYVPQDDPHLQRGDLRFEPREALASGADGLDAIRLIAVEARRCLVAGGWLVLEHGFDQGPAVRRLLCAAGLRDPRSRRDLADLERVTLARAG